MEHAREYLDASWHCSEGILKAVGAYYLDEINPQALKLSTPFAGGIGGTKEEMCGALSGGLMVIGALYGRTNAQMNDDHCTDMAAEYLARFLEHFGYIQCANLKENWVVEKDQKTCSVLTAEAAGVLLDVLEGDL